MSHLDALLTELRSKADALVVAPPAATEVAKAVEAAPVAAVAEAAPVVEAKAAETVEAKPAEGEEVAKSFKVKDEAGVEHDAIDGFALIKALGDDMTALRAEVATLKGAIEAAPKAPDAEALTKSFTDHLAPVANGTEEMAKALGATMDALASARTDLAAASARLAAQGEQITAQDAVLKSLTENMEKIGAQGVGRVSTVSVHERPSVAAVQKAAPTMGEVFAKAQALNVAGTINAIDVSRVNSWVNSGRGIPPDLAHHFAA
jgi:hypothetical protein